MQMSCGPKHFYPWLFSISSCRNVELLGNYLLKDAVKKRKLTGLQLGSCVTYQRKDETRANYSRSLFIELTGDILQGSADVYFKCVCKPTLVTK